MKYGSLNHYGPIGVEMYLISLVPNAFIILHGMAETIKMPSSAHLQPISAEMIAENENYL
jgi:hypothetical protein